MLLRYGGGGASGVTCVAGEPQRDRLRITGSEFPAIAVPRGENAVEPRPVRSLIRPGQISSTIARGTLRSELLHSRQRSAAYWPERSAEEDPAAGFHEQHTHARRVHDPEAR